VLGESNRSFARLYSSEGRPSIAPEQLLSALLLQVLYGIRSERQLMEQLRPFSASIRRSASWTVAEAPCTA
jgi:hypothetical protein